MRSLAHLASHDPQSALADAKRACELAAGENLAWGKGHIRMCEVYTYMANTLPKGSNDRHHYMGLAAHELKEASLVEPACKATEEFQGIMAKLQNMMP